MPVFTSGREAAQAQENKKVLFCQYCGTKLDEGARFCKHCGEAVSGKYQERRSSQVDENFGGNPTERKTVYEGYIHKCPSCGEIIDAFTTVCPSCGYEIRGTRASTSAQGLAQKIELISSQQMPDFQEKRSVMKIVFGRDFREKDEVEEARNHFENQKRQEMASLIINYTVPNTKEDILEFMILAASNIDVKHGIDDEVTKAWIIKLDQIYHKAQISMNKHPDFPQIENIYMTKKQELKKQKRRPYLIAGICSALWLFLMGLLWNPATTAGLTAGLLVLIFLGIIFFKKN